MIEAKNIYVRKSIVVNAPLEHTFNVFVHQHNAWWPRTHHIGKTESFDAVIEPRSGGRWYERSSDGSECDWGRVLAYEAPTRLLLSWEISAQWTHDADVANEVEVLFSAPAPGQTLVQLEHRKIERYGDMAEVMRGVFDSDGGWPGILARMAAQAEADALAA
jgi:uncharacterized protein YndB with AHSA1/START domain